jgi:cyclic pyranopterin phosphate synthase
MPHLLKKLKTIAGIENVALTTNGFLLGAYLDEAEVLGENSLPDSINISLDALNCERYRRLTRCKDADPAVILPIIDRLLEKQITVKINCVPVKSVNEEEILPLAALARDRNIAVRFIELMPIGCASGYQFVSGADVAKQIEKAFGTLIPFNGISGSGPAVYYSLAEFTGKIGFINAVSCGFCGTCNRLRLTSEGFLKLCLSKNMGIDLRMLMRNGADDSELAHIIQNVIVKKPEYHSLLEQHKEGMSEIGG